MSALSQTKCASAILTVPRISLHASASSGSATDDEPQKRKQLFVATLRIWALTLVILIVPALAALLLHARPTGHVRLESSEIRRSQILSAHAAQADRVGSSEVGRAQVPPARP